MQRTLDYISHFFIVSLYTCLLQVGDLSNPEVRLFTEHLDKITYGGKYRLGKFLLCVCGEI